MEHLKLVAGERLNQELALLVVASNSSRHDFRAYFCLHSGRKTKDKR